MNGSAQNQAVPWSERLTAALGGAIVLAALCYLGWYALTYEQTPPRLSVEVVAIEAEPGGHLVRFKVFNTGTITAEDLLIRGTLRRDGQTVEESEATLPFVPAQSEREGGLLFSQNPADYELVLKPLGYSQP